MSALEISVDDYEAHILDILNIKDLSMLSLLDISTEIGELVKLNEMVQMDVMAEFRKYLKKNVSKIEFKSSYQKFFILIDEFREMVRKSSISPKLKEAEKYADALSIKFNECSSFISFQIDERKGFRLSSITRDNSKFFSDDELRVLATISSASKLGAKMGIKKLLRWNEQNELKERLIVHYEMVLSKKHNAVLANKIDSRIRGFLSVGGM